MFKHSRPPWFIRAFGASLAICACGGHDAAATPPDDTSAPPDDTPLASTTDASLPDPGELESSDPDTLDTRDARETGAPIDALPAPTYDGHFATSSGFAKTSLTIAGVARQVETYLPASRASAPALVIAFHGTSGGSHDLFDATELTDLADQHGFVIAAPLARMRGENEGDWDNHSGNDRYWETFPNTDPSANPDLVLVRAIIAEAGARFGIDPHKVYTLGYSNGGFFALTAAVALRDQIAAFAEAASGLVRCPTTGDCAFRGAGATCEALQAKAGWCACDGAEKPIALPTSGRVPPGYLAHNTWDDTVSVYYSCALAARLGALGADVTIALWSDSSAGHAIAPGFASAAWTFFAAHPLP